MTDAERELLTDAEYKLLEKLFREKRAVSDGLWLGGAFVLGALFTVAVTLITAPSYDPLKIQGDMMLCRASGVITDASGVRYYPEMLVRIESVAP